MDAIRRMSWFQRIAWMVLAIQIFFFIYVVWNFVFARATAATSLTYGLPLGALGAMLFLPVKGEGKERLAGWLLGLSLATFFQGGILLARLLAWVNGL